MAGSWLAVLILDGRISPHAPALADASARSQRFRGIKSADHVPEDLVHDDAGHVVAKLSYNGRVWPPGAWRAGLAPILEAVELR